MKILDEYIPYPDGVNPITGEFNLFVYYYFLGRKYGHPPNVSAKWAIDFCEWLDKDSVRRGFAPSLKYMKK